MFKLQDVEFKEGEDHKRVTVNPDSNEEEGDTSQNNIGNPGEEKSVRIAKLMKATLTPHKVAPINPLSRRAHQRKVKTPADPHVPTKVCPHNTPMKTPS